MNRDNAPEIPVPSPRQTPGETSAPQVYVPGFAARKALMIAFGILLLAAGISQMGLPLKLLFTGARATAEATRVIKSKPGTPELILTTDAEIHARQETRDRSSTFWNEFHFQDATGRDIVVRSPVGGQLKPLYPLIDEDGLPTTLPVHYDPRQPEVVSFPTIFSTWFAPGVLVCVGFGITFVGSFLLYWSNKPIEKPVLASR
ncbi:MAG: hypothetical protein PHQ12_07275 [Chthoniobacteraceae bacterium]|nr:hypothetical protein [Chthoniobacteraceae bacterium]